MMSGGFRQFDEEWDLHCETPARTNYAICFTPRSGSHYLGHLMYGTGAMGYPLEYFHPDHFRRWANLSGKASDREVIGYIQSRRTSTNGCFGFKAHFGLFTRLFDGSRIDDVFPGCKFIRIEREDKLAQAISLVRARQTNQWISMHTSTGQTRYEFDAIEAALSLVLEEQASWCRLFSLSGWDHFRVTYEFLVRNPEQCLTEIAEYLNVSRGHCNARVVLPEKQAGAESLEWRSRFLEDVKARHRDYPRNRLSLNVP